jgi:Zn-dependent protease with chaperone function
MFGFVLLCWWLSCFLCGILAVVWQGQVRAFLGKGSREMVETGEKPEVEHKATSSTDEIVREQVLVPCRHCGQPNRLYRMKMGDPPREPSCGACGGFLWLTDEPLVGLSPTSYQHPLDREALQAIHKLPGVDSLLRTLLSESFERASRMYHFSSFLHCGPQQAPRVYDIFCEAARRFGLETVPDLFLTHQEHLGAYTSGVKHPFVAVSATLVEELRDDELLVVFAHELGHWHSGHVMYKMAGRLLSRTAGALVAGTFGLGSLAMIPLRMALLKWERCAALTADRAALLVVRDVDVCLRTMMKLAGGSAELDQQLSRDAFLAQVAQVKTMEQEHLFNRIFSLLQELFQAHPVPIWRASELLSWMEEGEFLSLLSGVGWDGATSERTQAEAGEVGEGAEPLLDQAWGMGKDVVSDVQGALQQGGSLLRQWFGGK